MKKNLLCLFTVASALLVLTGCNEKAKLAQSINGSWNGVAERVQSSDVKATVTVTRELTFTVDPSDKTSGSITASAPFTIETGTPLLGADVQPIAVTASGTATVSGKWHAIDDDEIAVVYDLSTFAVNVDPEATYLEYNVLTEESAPELEPLKAASVTAVTQLVKRDFPLKVFNYNKIDDIKVKGGMMSCEVSDRDYTFHRDN